MVKTGLWVHVCVRQLPPTCHLRSNCIAKNCLGSSQAPAGRGALSYIVNLCCRVPEWTSGAFKPYGQNKPLGARSRGSAPAHIWLKVNCIAGESQASTARGALSYIVNLCWRVPEWNWGAFEPNGQNGPLGAGLRRSAPAYMWLKVKRLCGGYPGIPPNPLRPRWTKLHRKSMLWRPWMDLGGLWALWTKRALEARFRASAPAHMCIEVQLHRGGFSRILASPCRWRCSKLHRKPMLTRPLKDLRAFEHCGQNGPLLQVCVCQPTPTCDLRSNGIAGYSLGSPQPPAGRGALTYIGNLCWRVPEWALGAFKRYGQNGPLGARLRPSTPNDMWLKVKLHRGGLPGIPSTPRRQRCTNLHRKPMLTRPWTGRGGL